MKEKKKKLARELRKKGWSLKEIRKKLNVAKSSVSIWVRDMELTVGQKQELSKRGIKKEVIERRRKTRLDRENVRRQIIIDEAKREIKTLSKKELKLIGIALYWAEGAKTQRGRVQFSNADPRLIKLMMSFFKQVCKVPKKRFRGHISIHPHLDVITAENYWHKISGIPLNQFFKTTMQQSRASKGKKDSLPYGTFNIEISITELYLKIMGWIDGLDKSKIKSD
jgi:predicted transcriptional regulator